MDESFLTYRIMARACVSVRIMHFPALLHPNRDQTEFSAVKTLSEFSKTMDISIRSHNQANNIWERKAKALTS